MAADALRAISNVMGLATPPPCDKRRIGSMMHRSDSAAARNLRDWDRRSREVAHASPSPNFNSVLEYCLGR